MGIGVKRAHVFTKKGKERTIRKILGGGEVAADMEWQDAVIAFDRQEITYFSELETLRARLRRGIPSGRSA